MARKRYPKTLTITVDAETMEALARLRATGGKYAGRLYCNSAVIRRAIMKAAADLGKT